MLVMGMGANGHSDSPMGLDHGSCGGGGVAIETKSGGPAGCAGCGGRIMDRFYLLAADRQWHTNCLQCCECKIQLDSELSCFAKEGNIYCKDDYLRRFGMKKCARCQHGIASHEMVMRARDLVYHLACFSCAVCNLELTTGDYYGMRDQLVYCQLHYEALYLPSPEPHSYHHLDPSPPPLSSTVGLSSPYHGHNGSPTSGASPGGHPYFQNGISPIHKGRPRKRKGVDSLMGYGMGIGDPCDPIGHHMQHPGLDSDMYAHQTPPARTKRMRTSFKHHQLRTMKSYFAMNHNPDAKDLKQLAHKTGLTKRVLQVWFQNARAKYRRTATKKDDEKGDKSSSECGGDQNMMSPHPDDQDSGSIASSGLDDGGGGSSINFGDTPSPHDPNADTSHEDMDLDDDITTYSELKTASPALADEVKTISSMPASARSQIYSNATSIHGHSNHGNMLHGLLPVSTGPNNMGMSGGLMSNSFVEIFN